MFKVECLIFKLTVLVEWLESVEGLERSWWGVSPQAYIHYAVAANATHDDDGYSIPNDDR